VVVGRSNRRFIDANMGRQWQQNPPWILLQVVENDQLKTSFRENGEPVPDALQICTFHA
jgi:hypothetical protein